MTDETQKQLNKKLGEAAKGGKVEEVLSCLQAGAEINGVSETLRTPLMYAAYKGHLRVAEILLQAGADRTLRDNVNETAEDDARKRGYPEIETLLREYTPDEVIFRRQLGDRTLQESFNFITRERISLIRKSPRGDVEAMTRESFSVIEDESVLRKAFEEHVRRGGKADEALVFPHRLPKNKLTREG